MKGIWAGLSFAVIVIVIIVISIKSTKSAKSAPSCTVDNYVRDGLHSMIPDFNNNNTPLVYNGKCVAPYLNLPGNGTLSCDYTCENDSTLKSYWGKSGTCAATTAIVEGKPNPQSLDCDETAKNIYGPTATTVCGCKLSMDTNN